jgi:hypothetical protein
VTVHVAERTLTVEFPDGAQRTFTRTSTKPVRSYKAHRPRTPTPRTNRRPAHDTPGHHRSGGAVSGPAPPTSRVLRIADVTTSGGPGPRSLYRPCGPITTGQATTCSDPTRRLSSPRCDHA